MTAQLAFKSYTTEYWYKWMEYCKGVLGRYRNGPLTCTLVSQDQYSCFTRHLLQIFLLKVAFIQKVRFVFQISKSPKKIYSKLLSRAWNLNLLFTVIGGKFKFQVQDSDLEYYVFGYLEIWKTHRTFWKKKTLTKQHLK